MVQTPPKQAPQADRLATIEWSVVLAAGGAAGQEAGQALTRLCMGSWYSLEAYVRRRVGDIHEAQALTPGFLAHLLEVEAIGQADRSRGRFGTFLLTALKVFLADDNEGRDPEAWRRCVSPRARGRSAQQRDALGRDAGVCGPEHLPNASFLVTDADLAAISF